MQVFQRAFRLESLPSEKQPFATLQRSEAARKVAAWKTSQNGEAR
ncbi:hypothetical protein [Exiguobacterium oxidotolerans]|nr:hypothetical protein [Exiguobacterium oxidotolerans]